MAPARMRRLALRAVVIVAIGASARLALAAVDGSDELSTSDAPARELQAESDFGALVDRALAERPTATVLSTERVGMEGAVDAEGRLCLTYYFQPGPDQQFLSSGNWCGDPRTSDSIALFAIAPGPADEPGPMAIIGVTRSDVDRIDVRTSSGEERAFPTFASEQFPELAFFAFDHWDPVEAMLGRSTSSEVVAAVPPELLTFTGRTPDLG